MKILVTGANGLLGQKLCHLLLGDETIELIATTRGKLNFDLPSGTFVALDVTNEHSVNTVIMQTKPDVLIHTAAMTNVDSCESEREECWNNNVNAVEYLTKACEKNNVHLIHVSTDFIFDGNHGPLDEEAIPNPVSYYGESKLAAEIIVQRSKTNWAILRTILVYGVTKDMSRSNIVLWVKKSLEEGKTINVVNDQWRTPTLAEDLAMGCYLAAKQKAKGIYNISGEELMTPYDIAIETATFFKLDKSLIRQADSSNFKQPAKRPAKTGFIITKAQKELGYLPHSFHEGLAVVDSQLNALR
ncbi:MAG: NAD(P)-dependent oxidoreductase [Azospira oryzae]|jgi:dTDP-4-dehydrorhamnose reductase|nr:MAG: NAD(P)-dependent oxidoreductase [Azospira oryzae]